MFRSLKAEYCFLLVAILVLQSIFISSLDVEAVRYRGINTGNVEDDSTITLYPAAASAGNGDFMVAFIATDSSVTHNTPSGWSLLQSIAYSNAAKVSIFYKFAGFPEMDVNFTTGSSVNSLLGRLLVYNGVDTGDPFDVTAHTNGTTSATENMYAPEVVTTVNGDMIVRYIVVEENVADGLGAIGGASDRGIEQTSSYAHAEGATDIALANNGSTGSSTHGFSMEENTGTDYIIMTLALKDDVGGGGDTTAPSISSVNPGTAVPAYSFSNITVSFSEDITLNTGGETFECKKDSFAGTVVYSTALSNVTTPTSSSIKLPSELAYKLPGAYLYCNIDADAIEDGSGNTPGSEYQIQLMMPPAPLLAF